MFTKLIVCCLLAMLAIQMSWALPSNCTLEPEVGICRAHLERYFYNITTEECQLFIYGGCRGNANNFETVEDCKAECV